MTRDWLKGWLDLAVNHAKCKVPQRSSNAGYGRSDAAADKLAFEQMSDD